MSFSQSGDYEAMTLDYRDSITVKYFFPKINNLTEKYGIISNHLSFKMGLYFSNCKYQSFPASASFRGTLTR